MSLSVVVINLDRDLRRMRHMLAQLQGAGLRFQRFAAVDGASVPGEVRDYFDPDCDVLTAGEVGCYASHIAIWRKIESGEIPAPVLVLEDDVELPPSMRTLVQRLLHTLPENWDIVRLSYPSKRAALTVAELGNEFELVRYSQPPMSTGAYLISRTGALKMLAPGRRKLPVDHDLRRVWAWDLKTFGVSPPPVGTDCAGASSIDALAPGARTVPARRRRFARQRLREAAARFRYGIRDFGAWRWCALETLNAFGRVLPRRQRQAVLAWAGRAFGWPQTTHAESARHPIFMR